MMKLFIISCILFIANAQTGDDAGNLRETKIGSLDFASVTAADLLPYISEDGVVKTAKVNEDWAQLEELWDQIALEDGMPDASQMPKPACIKMIYAWVKKNRGANKKNATVDPCAPIVEDKVQEMGEVIKDPPLHFFSKIRPEFDSTFGENLLTFEREEVKIIIIQ
jgi:hypothetical protein